MALGMPNGRRRHHAFVLTLSAGKMFLPPPLLILTDLKVTNTSRWPVEPVLERKIW